MSSSLSRRCVRFGIHSFYVAVVAVVLTAGGRAVAEEVADKTADLPGPSFTTHPDDPAQPVRSTETEEKPKVAGGGDAAVASEAEAKADAKRAETSGKESSEAAEPGQKAETGDSDAKPEATDAEKPEVAEPSKESKEEKKKEESDATKAEKPDAFGEPLAPGMMKLIQDEIVAAFKKRGNIDRFARFQRYAIGKVNASAGRYTGSELAGNCRLRWYDHLMRNFVTAPIEAEKFTRELHKAARNRHDALAQVLAIAGEKMDVGVRKPRKAKPPTSPELALDAVKQSLIEAQTAYCAALAPLSKSEIRELQQNLVPVLSTQNQVGHTLVDRGTGRRLCDLMEKMDRDGLHVAAEALAPLADVDLLDQLKALPANGNVKAPGVTGTVVSRIDTPAGAIVVGGKGPNTYDLDRMGDVAAVIDLGGGNTYREGTVGTERPVLIVINLGGGNAFRGSKPGIQGGAVLGVSMLVNLEGNNTYEAADVAQGSALAGVGILIDYGSGNRFRGVRRVQGVAVGGLGIALCYGGKNDYRAAMWGQGVGGPLGFGLLNNVAGDNHYFCGGMWRNSYYPETQGCEGWGQGVGEGIRQVADGGIGVILDGGGENTYEFDYLSHGGGYWCGLGFARDFGGNTKRLITRTAYGGGPRNQPNFERFGVGWGCHYAMGFCFDDGGDNVYEGSIMGTGMAWDCSMGVLADFGHGNNHYTATGGLTQGTGGQMGFGILFHYDGDDVYEGYGQGYASNGISYHDLPACGGNFAFCIDYGGNDKYGCGAQNNSYIQRGDSGGFLIDRPRINETEAATTDEPAKAEKAAAAVKKSARPGESTTAIKKSAKAPRGS